MPTEDALISGLRTELEAAQDELTATRDALVDCENWRREYKDELARVEDARAEAADDAIEYRDRAEQAEAELARVRGEKYEYKTRMLQEQARAEEAETRADHEIDNFRQAAKEDEDEIFKAREQLSAAERRHEAELAAKDRELEWIRLEQIHFFETIGYLRRQLDGRDV
jgi:chromosome segregation ATPase